MPLAPATEILRPFRDAERRLHKEDGAWRIDCPLRPGPGRHVLATEDAPAEDGLVFALTLLNGHHASETMPLSTPRWLDLGRRMVWAIRGRARPVLERATILELRREREERPRHHALRRLKRNLVVALEPARPLLRRPLGALAIESTGPRNGRLVALVDQRWTPLADDLANIRLHLGMLVHARRIWYLAASPPGGPFAEPPAWEILGTTPLCSRQRVRGTLDQTVLGQIGFRVSSRIDAAVWRRVAVPKLTDSARSDRLVHLAEPASPARSRYPASSSSILTDGFLGEKSPLDSEAPGGLRWYRALGEGRFERTGDGAARVVAGPERPNPGRTAYVVDWPHPSGCDVCVTIIPPGRASGDGVLGRGGLLLMQDEANYVAVNNWYDDRYDGSSVSTFWRIDGEEDLYRAVWTNLGRRIQRGVPYRLRTVFDGSELVVFVNEEPVLERRVKDVVSRASPLAIRRVGLLANWEWGDDMGTVFRSFEAGRLSA